MSCVQLLDSSNALATSPPRLDQKDSYTPSRLADKEIKALHLLTMSTRSVVSGFGNKFDLNYADDEEMRRHARSDLRRSRAQVD